jgi:hypothetical protein
MILRIAACVGLALGLPILGGTLQLEFGFVSSGGGGTGSGRYSISSTIGEPLASSDPASGGDFSSRPGFLSQVVRWINAVPVANQDIIERPAGGEAHFLAADLLGNDADGDWDPLQLLSVDATTVQGGALYLDGPWIIYVPLPTHGASAEDGFNYRVSDGISGPVTGSVVIRAAGTSTSTASPLQIRVLGGVPALLELRFQGIAGRSYRLQRADSLAGPWVNAGTSSAGINGVIRFTEPQGGGSSFFRILEP